jgi:hypothetical protein
MADLERRLERIDVMLTVPQFFNDSEAMRVRQHPQEVGQFLEDQDTMRHDQPPGTSGKRQNIVIFKYSNIRMSLHDSF